MTTTESASLTVSPGPLFYIQQIIFSKQMKPNQLTTLRFILLFLIIASDAVKLYYLAIFFILLGFLTDHLDGFIARKYQKSSSIGIYYDHFVDKIFVHLLLIYYLSQNLLSFWIVALLILRDYLALGFRQYAISLKENIASVISGKIKLVSQGILLVFLALAQIISLPENLILIIGSVIVVWSFVSLVDLFRKNKNVLQQLWEEL